MKHTIKHYEIYGKFYNGQSFYVRHNCLMDVYEDIESIFSEQSDFILGDAEPESTVDPETIILETIYE